MLNRGCCSSEDSYMYSGYARIYPTIIVISLSPWMWMFGHYLGTGHDCCLSNPFPVYLARSAILLSVTTSSNLRSNHSRIQKQLTNLHYYYFSIIIYFNQRGKSITLFWIRITKKKENHIRAELMDAIYPTQWYSVALIPSYPFS